jgi:HTH-type transcriptional regulator/antitoxin HigA
MEITPIRTESDYRAALRVVSQLVDQDPSPDTPEGERLDVLSTLIEAYASSVWTKQDFRSKTLSR